MKQLGLHLVGQPIWKAAGNCSLYGWNLSHPTVRVLFHKAVKEYWAFDGVAILAIGDKHLICHLILMLTVYFSGLPNCKAHALDHCLTLPPPIKSNRKMFQKVLIIVKEA